MYAVILAGGGGTRLWPLSTPDRPKPFLPLLGERSLLQRTVDRLSPLVDQEVVTDVTVVTDRRYVGLVRAQLPAVHILAEPTGRNTAAAIALAVAAIERPEDEVMLVLPADHGIDPQRDGVFRGTLAAAETGLAGEAFGIDAPLVTLGIAVDRPATEYGYLIPDLERGATIDGLRACPLAAFEEKPRPPRAQELLTQPGVAWNAGIFLWRRSSIRFALERYTALLTAIAPAVRSPAALAAAYDRLTPISIDYAVMEGAARDDRVVMAAMDVGWSDLGGWPALLAALGGRATGRVVPPGEAVALGPDDLLIERRDRRLAVVDGPRGSISTAPTALLAGAAPDRSIVDALIERVSAQEVNG
ncbi:MAG: sugar phosphate nucleotidyltransferase [Candidatus Limnocylindrales bacterium]